MDNESEWSDSIDASKVEDAARRIEVEEVQCAISQVGKIREASGSSGVAIELF